MQTIGQDIVRQVAQEEFEAERERLSSSIPPPEDFWEYFQGRASEAEAERIKMYLVYFTELDPSVTPNNVDDEETDERSEEERHADWLNFLRHHPEIAREYPRDAEAAGEERGRVRAAQWIVRILLGAVSLVMALLALCGGGCARAEEPPPSVQIMSRAPTGAFSVHLVQTDGRRCREASPLIVPASEREDYAFELWHNAIAVRPLRVSLHVLEGDWDGMPAPDDTPRGWKESREVWRSTIPAGVDAGAEYDEHAIFAIASRASLQPNRIYAFMLRDVERDQHVARYKFVLRSEAQSVSGAGGCG